MQRSFKREQCLEELDDLHVFGETVVERFAGTEERLLKSRDLLNGMRSLQARVVNKDGRTLSLTQTSFKSDGSLATFEDIRIAEELALGLIAIVKSIEQFDPLLAERNKLELEKTNRNVKKAQEFSSTYNVHPMYLYYSSVNTNALKASIPAKMGIRGWMERAWSAVKNVFDVRTEEQKRSDAEEKEREQQEKTAEEKEKKEEKEKGEEKEEKKKTKEQKKEKAKEKTGEKVEKKKEKGEEKKKDQNKERAPENTPTTQHEEVKEETAQHDKDKKIAAQIPPANTEAHSKPSIPMHHDKTKGKALMAACEAVFRKTEGDARGALDTMGAKNVEIIDSEYLHKDEVGSMLVRMKFDDGTSKYVYAIAGTESKEDGGSFKEQIQDLSDYAKILYKGPLDALIDNGFRIIGENIDDLSGGSLASDPAYIAYDKSKLINYAFKERPEKHISRLQQMRQKYGIQEKLIVTGFSGGGLEAQLLRAMAPELVSKVYSYDAPGAEQVINTITKGDEALKKSIYRDIHITNLKTNINKFGTNPDYADISIIDHDKHKFIGAIRAFEEKGITQMSSASSQNSEHKVKK